MSNRRGPHVIARPRRRPEITTTEIDTNKLNELVASVDRPPEISLGRATTRSVSDDALAELVGQQTRVAPAPTAPTRLAHTKRRDAPRAITAGGEGESFDDPTTIHTRAAGTVPIAIERTSRAATVEDSELAGVESPSAELVARGSAFALPLPAPEAASASDGEPVRPSKLAEGSAGMIPVLVRPATESVEVSLDESLDMPPPARSASTAILAVPQLTTATSVRLATIGLSGLVTAIVAAVVWWLVH